MNRNNSILLVDSDDISNFIVGRLAGKIGKFELTYISTAENALKYIEKNPEALNGKIIFEIYLPFMSGIDFLIELKKNNNNILFQNFLPMTSSVIPNDLKALLNLGVNEIIHKPITLDKMTSFLNNNQENTLYL